MLKNDVNKVLLNMLILFCNIGLGGREVVLPTLDQEVPGLNLTGCKFQPKTICRFI